MVLVIFAFSPNLGFDALQGRNDLLVDPDLAAEEGSVFGVLGGRPVIPLLFSESLDVAVCASPVTDRFIEEKGAFSALFFSQPSSPNMIAPYQEWLNLLVSASSDVLVGSPLVLALRYRAVRFLSQSGRQSQRGNEYDEADG